MSNNQNQTLDIALHMFCLLFADNTALVSSTAKKLTKHPKCILSIFKKMAIYDINCNKTKILILMGLLKITNILL